jgi:transcription termination factor Rho
MSVGSQELERSTLEAKDRESLHQIATAMGGKPGSRAKKADIITMILKLAGVTDPGPGSSPAPAADGADQPDAPADGQLPLEAVSPATDEDDPAPSDEAQPASTNGNGHPVSEAPAGSGGGDAERNGNADARHDDQRDQARDGGGRTAPGQPRTEETEQSSRRRRRRGRDRDRQGQPGAAGNAAPAAANDDFLGEPVEVLGLLDLRDEGYGFLRVKAYLPSKEDVYVSVKQVRQFGLRKGDELKGAARPASRNEKNPALLRIDEVNGKEPELNKQRGRFEELTAQSPTEQLRLEATGDDADITARVLDLVTPIGKGQRGLVVSPPGAGRTEILKRIGAALEANHDELLVTALLIDARPEEVTAVQAGLKGEVVASTFDRPADEHLMVAELVIERSKRLVEEGRDVVVLLDGLTRLARAYDLAAPPTGRVVGGAVDAAALQPIKRLLGAARAIDEGGSLTIIATALVDSGARADEVIVEELQGAVNLELRLDRNLAEHRTFPAVDVRTSSTRHDELIVGDQHGALTRLRRELVSAADSGGPTGALEVLLARLTGTATNAELLASLPDA